MKSKHSYEILEQTQSGSEFQNPSNELDNYNKAFLEYTRIIGIQERIPFINKLNEEDIKDQIIREDPHKWKSYNPKQMARCDEKKGYEFGFYWLNRTMSYEEFGKEASKIPYSFYPGIRDKNKNNTYFIRRDTSDKSQLNDDKFMGRTEFDQYLKKNHLKAKLKKYHCLLSDLNDFRGSDASNGYRTYNVICYVPVFEKDLDNPPIKPTIQIEYKEKELEGKVMNIGDNRQEEPDFTFIYSNSKNGGPEDVSFEISLDGEGTKAFKEYIVVTKKLQRVEAKNNIDLIKEFIVPYRILFPSHIKKIIGI